MALNFRVVRWLVANWPASLARIYSQSEATIFDRKTLARFHIGRATDIRLLPIDIVHMRIESVQIFCMTPKTRAMS
jgi:hypothetical protein